MKPFTTIAMAILVLAGLIHLARLATGFSVAIAGTEVPIWANALGAIIALGVAWKMRGEMRSRT